MACDCDGCTGCGICTVCTGSCGSTCSYNCDSGCDNTCKFTCNTCALSCGGCDSGCNTGCYTSCLGSCSGGCNGCNGSCSGQCNTACGGSNNSAVIANLGSNIKSGNLVSYQDFVSLRDALHNEITRRGYAAPSDAFTVAPAPGVWSFIMKEHPQKSLNDANLLYGYGYRTASITTNPYKVINTGDVIKASDLTNVITYCKELMSTVVPR